MRLIERSEFIIVCDVILVQNNCIGGETNESYNWSNESPFGQKYSSPLTKCAFASSCGWYAFNWLYIWNYFCITTFSSNGSYWIGQEFGVVTLRLGLLIPPIFGCVRLMFVIALIFVQLEVWESKKWSCIKCCFKIGGSLMRLICMGDPLR